MTLIELRTPATPDACDHGYLEPHCPIVGCIASRPAMALIDWKAADAEPREAQGYEGTVHRPEALAKHEEVQRLGSRDTATGVIAPGKVFVGVQEDGTRAPGACSWEWRPPTTAPVRGHEEMALQANGVTSGYQQAPPIGNVPGAVYGSAQETKRHLHVISEAEAQRVTMREQGEYFAAMGKAELAEVMGLSESQLRRRRKGRSRTG